MEACFVYVLTSQGRGGTRTYVGWTTDLDRRLAAHNEGRGARSTRGRHWQLVYAERFPTRRQAMAREWALKRDHALRRQLAAGMASQSSDGKTCRPSAPSGRSRVHKTAASGSAP